MTTANPEIASTIHAAGIQTNFHDLGAGFPVLFIHGSGPGVSAWANWRLALPELAKTHRVIAPDMVGFGFTDRPSGIAYDMDTWVRQAVGLLDALGLKKRMSSAIPSAARSRSRWRSAIPSASAGSC